MNDGKADNLVSYLGFSVVAALMVVWILTAWSGFLLGVVPDAPGDSHRALLLGHKRAKWDVIHSWLSVTAVFITAIEIIISWKSFREGIGYLTEAKSDRAID